MDFENNAVQGTNASEMCIDFQQHSHECVVFGDQAAGHPAKNVYFQGDYSNTLVLESATTSRPVFDIEFPEVEMFVFHYLYNRIWSLGKRIPDSFCNLHHVFVRQKKICLLASFFAKEAVFEFDMHRARDLMLV